MGENYLYKCLYDTYNDFYQKRARDNRIKLYEPEKSNKIKFVEPYKFIPQDIRTLLYAKDNLVEYHLKIKLDDMIKRYDYDLEYGYDDNLINNSNLHFVGDSQNEYWFVFEMLDNTYYLINLHPKPNHLYAYVKKSVQYQAKYLKLKPEHDIPNIFILPEIDWLIDETDNTYIPPKKYKLTELHKEIIKMLSNENNARFIDLYTTHRVQYDIPDDIVLPMGSGNIDNPIGILAECYIYNARYGDGYIVEEKHHQQYQYWFPFFYGGWAALHISLINLHPCPDFIYGIRRIWEATDYSPLNEGDFYKYESKTVNYLTTISSAEKRFIFDIDNDDFEFS